MTNTKNTKREMYTFDCGCSLPIIGPSKFPKSNIPSLDIDYDKLPLDCPAVWNLIGKGQTVGIFQLESSFARGYTKKLKPENIEHLSALGAVLRPGCSQASTEYEGINVTTLFCMRKNGEKEVTYYHPSLEPILKNTFALLCYQESAMAIARDLAGFDPVEVDYLRKAIGRKLPEEMAKVERLFLEKAKQKGIVTEKQAAVIFDGIKRSQRYAFCRAHAVEYGLVGYQMAYVKTHFPVAFFTSKLKRAKNKGGKAKNKSGMGGPKGEMRGLIEDAKLFNINVYPPDITKMNLDFITDGQDITFGLTNISGLGDSNVKHLQEILTGINFKELTWYKFLCEYGGKITKSVIEPLILTGALRCFGESRANMLREYNELSKTFKKKVETEWIAEHYDEYTNLLDLMRGMAKLKKNGGGCHSESRLEIVNSIISILQQPYSTTEDNISSIAFNEEKYLGISLTCHKSEIKGGNFSNTTCKEVIDGKIRKNMIIKVLIENVHKKIVKTGPNVGNEWATLKVSDTTCAIEDLSVYSPAWAQNKELIGEGMNVEILLDTFKNISVKKVWPL